MVDNILFFGNDNYGSQNYADDYCGILSDISNVYSHLGVSEGIVTDIMKFRPFYGG
mgnify:CR=1 FL=1